MMLDSIQDMCAQIVRTVGFAELHLAMEKQKYHKWQQQSDELNSQQEKCSFLDVGGQPFHVSVDVLHMGRSKLLAELTSGSFASETGEDGYLFLDRDPQQFVTILNYLRTGTIILPDDRDGRRAIDREAVYFQMENFKEGGDHQPCIIVLEHGQTDILKFNVYNVRSNTWDTLLCPLFEAFRNTIGHGKGDPKQRQSIATVSHKVLALCAAGNCLHILVESSAKDMVPSRLTLVRYDPRSGWCWVMSEIPTLVDCCDMVYFKPFTLIFGEFCGTGRCKNITQQFNEDSGIWSQPNELQALGPMGSMFVVNHCLVVVTCCLDLQAFQYNATRDHWVLLWSASEVNDGGIVAPIHGHLIVGGGEALGSSDDDSDAEGSNNGGDKNDGFAETKFLNPENGDMVRKAPHLTIYRMEARAMAIDDQVFLLGGHGKTNEFESSVEVLKSLKGPWTQVTTMPKKKYDEFVAAAVWI